jgi:Ca2+-binding RTX toxin-like protein
VYIDAEGSSHNLGTFYNSGNGSYTTADGLITYSGGVFSLPGGDSVQLSLGDSGVNLILIPESGNSETGNTITGDFEPFDFDPNQEGIQSKNDEWGNVIPDTTKPDPGREDTLYDTTASDKIEGQGGDDCITSSRGGNDWLSGGDGDDTIDATAATGNCTLKGGDGDDYIDATGTTGNCILEGGTGADFLLAGTGSDKIFAESYGEMASLIAAGETAPGSGSTGDMGYGGDGNDFVYGSNNNDMLYGGLGKDLLVGGGGSDIVDGGTGNDARLLKYPEGHANAHMLCCAAPLPGFRRGRLAATYAKSTSHYSGFARPKYSGLRLAPERF